MICESLEPDFIDITFTEANSDKYDEREFVMEMKDYNQCEQLAGLAAMARLSNALHQAAARSLRRVETNAVIRLEVGDSEEPSFISEKGSQSILEDAFQSLKIGAHLTGRAVYRSLFSHFEKVQITAPVMFRRSSDIGYADSTSLQLKTINLKLTKNNTGTWQRCSFEWRTIRFPKCFGIELDHLDLAMGRIENELVSCSLRALNDSNDSDLQDLSQGIETIWFATRQQYQISMTFVAVGEYTMLKKKQEQRQKLGWHGAGV